MQNEITERYGKQGEKLMPADADKEMVADGAGQASEMRFMTKKLRDTAHRINGVGRLSKSFALKNSISNKSISTSSRKSQEGISENLEKKQNSFPKEQDAEYLELAKDPEKNKARLREMVDAAARESGYNVKRIKMSTLQTAQFSKMIRKSGQTGSSTVDGLSIANVYSLVKQYDKEFKPGKSESKALWINSGIQCRGLTNRKRRIIIKVEAMITKIVRINVKNSEDVSRIKKVIITNEYQRIALPYKVVGDYIGEKYISIDKKRDHASFQEYKARRKGAGGKESNIDSAESENGNRSLQQNSGNDRADDLTSAFSMPEGKQYSVPKRDFTVQEEISENKKSRNTRKYPRAIAFATRQHFEHWLC